MPVTPARLEIGLVHHALITFLLATVLAESVALRSQVKPKEVRVVSPVIGHVLIVASWYSVAKILASNVALRIQGFLLPLSLALTIGHVRLAVALFLAVRHLALSVEHQDLEQ
jgi:hypothetical protein